MGAPLVRQSRARCGPGPQLNRGVTQKMKKPNNIPKELIAPCGMNCAICSRYLSKKYNLKRSQCSGCRPANKNCSYLFEKCSGINNGLKGNLDASFCYECDQYPCKHINRMDTRYRINYGMSVKNNLECIKKYGVEQFLSRQYEKYRCSKCDDLISIHNGKCFKCNSITRLVEKHNKKY